MNDETRAQRKAVILSGSGRYADPWHPFPETSAALAEIIAAEGFDVEIADDVDQRAAQLAEGGRGDDASREVDLLVVNLGRPAEADSTLDGATRAGLLSHLRRGGPLLSLHSSSTTFSGIPEWEAIEGGVWAQGETMHPPYGRAQVLVHADRSPIVAGLGDFQLDDERYTALRVNPGVNPLLAHRHEGVEHPLLWSWQYEDARVVYDALGHDAASYASAEHREILARTVRWLVGDLA